MPRFEFTAIDPTGRERNGVLEASDRDQAAAQLQDKGLFPLRVATGARDATEVFPPAEGAGRARRTPLTIGRPVSARGLMLFTRQLATMVQSGLPLLRALQVLQRQEAGAALRGVLDDLIDNVNTGRNLSEGLAQHPRVFDRLYVNMVRAGEAGSQLGLVLQQLARFLEKTEKVKGRVRAALFYPVTVIVITVSILTALLLFVVPKFRTIFHDVLKGAPLPALTQAVLNASDFVRGHALLLCGGVVVLGIGGALARRTPWGARMEDGLRLHLPVFGPLWRKAAIGRFCRTLGTLLGSGVPVLQALQITRETAGSVRVAEAVLAVHDRIKAGETLAAPIAANRLFPPMVSSMVEVGEETGTLNEMLGRIADIADEEVDNAVSGLTSLIEPVMIVVLALVVGTVVVALFLPIVRILQMMT